MKNKIIAIQTMIILLFLFSNVESSSERRTIQMTLGKKEFTIDDTKKHQFDVAPMIVNGKLMVQARTLFSNNVIGGTEINYRKETNNIFIYCEEPKIFYNGGENDTILSLIGSARKSIDIQMYRLQESEVIEALRIAGKKQGVHVRIILDKHKDNCKYGKGKDKKNTETTLEYGDPSCEVKWKANKGAIMHRKLAIIDGTTFILGSTNWTEPGLNTGERKNWEISLIFKNQEISKSLIDTFNEDWDKYTQPVYNCEE